MVFTKNELQGRINKLQHNLQESGFDGVVILQRADLIYYIGAAFQGALAVPAKGDAILYVWRGQGRLDDSCPVEIQSIRGFGKLNLELKNSPFIEWKTIGFEEDVLPISMWKRLGPGVWSNGDFKDISPSIRTQRMVKSTAELELVRQSGKILSGGFEALRGIIRKGVFEYEVQAQMEVHMRRHGDQAAGRTRGFNAEARGVVASGPSAGEPTAFDGPIGQPGRNPLAPMGAGNAIIKANQPVICDVAIGYNGYMTDMTRTYAIGKLDSKFYDAHNFCVEILEEIRKRMVPGANPEELYIWALNEAEKHGYSENYMNRGLNKVRFLGHGIGIEMDEWPVLANRFTTPLEEGMVIAVEPKVIYDDGGVGLEETVVVQPGGAEVVTPMERGIVQIEE